MRSAHREGDIHIHDLDFLTLTTTCTQIDLTQLFKGGFSTGHGVLREPQDIGSYSALACIAIQSNQNDQHGGQAIASFDYGMAPGVAKTYIKEYRRALGAALELLLNHDAANEEAKSIVRQIENEIGAKPTLKPNKEFDDALRERLTAMSDEATAERIMPLPRPSAANAKPNARTYQAMEALIHNLNTMHSRAGAQTPFSLHQLRHGHLAGGRAWSCENVLLATETRAGQRRNADFPHSDFQGQGRRELQPRRPELRPVQAGHASVSAKRLFPNFSFLDAPFNLKYYKPGHHGDGDRVHGLPHPRDGQRTTTPTREIVLRPGQPVALPPSTCRASPSKANGDIDWFFEELDRTHGSGASTSCMDRFEIQCSKKVQQLSRS